jgi:hypothetical protein
MLGATSHNPAHHPAESPDIALGMNTASPPNPYRLSETCAVGECRKGAKTHFKSYYGIGPLAEQLHEVAGLNVQKPTIVRFSVFLSVQGELPTPSLTHACAGNAYPSPPAAVGLYAAMHQA